MAIISHVDGAHDDIQKVTSNGLSPLCIAFLKDHGVVVQWLILNRTLSPGNDDGVIDDATMRRDLDPSDNAPKLDDDKRLAVLAWARDSITNHDNVKLFLKGTIIFSSSTFRRHPKNDYPTRSSKRMKVSPSSSPLVLFKGKSSILGLVAEYVAGTQQ